MTGFPLTARVLLLTHRFIHLRRTPANIVGDNLSGPAISCTLSAEPDVVVVRLRRERLKDFA